MYGYKTFSIPLDPSDPSREIRFHVNNPEYDPIDPKVYYGNSPMGVRAEMQISTVPEAPTYLAGIGLLAILGFGWMFHPSRMNVIKSS